MASANTTLSRIGLGLTIVASGLILFTAFKLLTYFIALGLLSAIAATSYSLFTHVNFWKDTHEAANNNQPGKALSAFLATLKNILTDRAFYSMSLLNHDDDDDLNNDTEEKLGEEPTDSIKENNAQTDNKPFISKRSANTMTFSTSVISNYFNKACKKLGVRFV